MARLFTTFLPAVPLPPTSAEAPASSFSARESVAPFVPPPAPAIAPAGQAAKKLSQPERHDRFERDQNAISAKPVVEQRRGESGGVAAGKVAAMPRETRMLNSQQAQLAAPPASAAAAANTSAAPPVYAAPAAPVPPQTLALKADERAETWIKRIVELKQQGKTRESDKELAKFRKRYPDFALPEELKERK